MGALLRRPRRAKTGPLKGPLRVPPNALGAPIGLLKGAPKSFRGPHRTPFRGPKGPLWGPPRASEAPIGPHKTA